MVSSRSANNLMYRVGSNDAQAVNHRPPTIQSLPQTSAQPITTGVFSKMPSIIGSSSGVTTTPGNTLTNVTDMIKKVTPTPPTSGLGTPGTSIYGDPWTPVGGPQGLQPIPPGPVNTLPGGVDLKPLLPTDPRLYDPGFTRPDIQGSGSPEPPAYDPYIGRFSETINRPDLTNPNLWEQVVKASSDLTPLSSSLQDPRQSLVGRTVDLDANGIDDRLQQLGRESIINDFQAKLRAHDLKTQQQYWKRAQQQMQLMQQMQQAMGGTPMSSLQQQPPVLQDFNLRQNALSALGGAGYQFNNPLNDLLTQLLQGRGTVGSGSSNPLLRISR